METDNPRSAALTTRIVLGGSLIGLIVIVLIGVIFGGSTDKVAGRLPDAGSTSTSSSVDEADRPGTMLNGTPTADFESTCDGFECSFTDLSTDDGALTGWTWDFGDGHGAAGPRSTHDYTASGIYLVSLTVVDDGGVSSEATRSITVTLPVDDSLGDGDPSAAFAAECDALTCSFENLSTDDGSLADYVWTFGDGQSSRDANPTHVYAASASYEVRLVVTDELGAVGEAVQTVTPSVAATVGKPSPVARVAPLVYPFGPHVAGYGGWELVDSKYSSAEFEAYYDTLVDELNLARSEGRSMIVMLARSRHHYQNPDGTFNLDMWKARIDEYAGFDFTPWINDGTLLVHYLISEPMARSRWGGEVIPAAVLDEMARYSKQYWPTLPTAVREQPTDLIQHAGGYGVPVPGWNWTYLDTSWARYSARKGPIEEFIADEVAAARAKGLGLILGMNVLSGGDGSSGVIGYADGWVMSVDEALDYGSQLISEPYGCGMIMWQIDIDDIVYFALPEIDAAMTELAALASTRSARSCVAP